MKFNEVRSRIKSFAFSEIIIIGLFIVGLSLFKRLDNILYFILKKKIKPDNKIPEALTSELRYYRDILWGNKNVVIENHKNKFAKNCKQILNYANAICNGKIELFEQTFLFPKYNWYYDPISKNNWPENIFFSKAKVEVNGLGDVKYVLEYNKLHHLVYLAQAYYYTGHTKYYDELDNQISSWIEQNPINSSVIWKIKLDLAFRNINLILVSMLMLDAPNFSSELFPKLLGIFKENIKQINRYSSAKWFKSHNGGNHTIVEIVGVMLPMLIFKNLYNKKQFNKLFKQLDDALIDTISIDGVYLEQSASYSKLVTEALIYLDVFLKLKGIKGTVIFQNKLKKLVVYIYKIQDNSILPNFGDSDGAKLFHSNRNFFDVSHILYYGRENLNLTITLTSDVEAMNWFGRPFNNSKSTETIAFQPEEEINLKHGGQFVFKSNDRFGVYFFIRSIPHSYGESGKGSHAHNDLLSIILSIKGIPVLVDKGTCFYNSGLIQRNIDRSMSVHNTVFCESVEQATLINKWAYGKYPEAIIVDFNKDLNGLKYKEGITYGGINHTRTVSYLEGQLGIFDELRSEGSKIGYISFLLHPLIHGEIVSDNRIKLWGNQEYICELIIDGIISLKIENDEYYPLYSKKIKTTRIIGKFKCIFDSNKINTRIKIS